jgi:hippurate hydrolase
MLAWRKTLHGTAEVGFLEQVTAAFVAQKLSEFGITVVSRVGGTGVVGTLSCGESLQSIGLRAELDAVPKSGLVAVTRSASQASATHACGHDGHMAMLLGAAKHLSQTKRFDGTIRFIFQPAEESGTGAGAMIEDGLFTRFPVDALFGLHNVPSIPAGKFGIGVGPVSWRQWIASQSLSVAERDMMPRPARTLTPLSRLRTLSRHCRRPHCAFSIRPTSQQ